MGGVYEGGGSADLCHDLYGTVGEFTRFSEFSLSPSTTKEPTTKEAFHGHMNTWSHVS